MGNGYYPLIPGGRYDGPEPDNYTGDDSEVTPNDPYGRDDEDSRTWQTLDRRRIPYALLEEKHLLNILRTCRCGVVKVSDVTINALGSEVLRRGLEPLPDYENLAEGMTVSAVSSLYMWWRRVPAPRIPDLTAVFDLYLNGGEIAQFLVDDDGDRTEAEKRCIAALWGYDKHLQDCSPGAKMRCGEVLRRWARAMHVDEVLSL